MRTAHHAGRETMTNEQINVTRNQFCIKGNKINVVIYRIKGILFWSTFEIIIEMHYNNNHGDMIVHTSNSSVLALASLGREDLPVIYIMGLIIL